MYATSKLIIPPKPARDSPFIPKLRIRLRHSSNQSSNLDNETDYVDILPIKYNDGSNDQLKSLNFDKDFTSKSGKNYINL